MTVTVPSVPQAFEPFGPGTVIGGHYQVVKRLGTGSMGTVLLATDLTLDRYVAIKVLKPEIGERIENDARFVREARLLSRLSHPNVVTIHAFAAEGEGPDSWHYIVMEYVAGQTLEELVEREGVLEPRIFCHVVDQIANAISEAHARGIVHRDLKPGNILLTSVAGDDHFVKVVDFGLAKPREDDVAPEEMDDLVLTQGGLTLGTPAYIAPEQARGEKVDARTDIYSLGVLAFQLLTGGLPFVGNNPMALMMAHVMEPPKLPSEVRPDLRFEVGGGVDAAFARVLSKYPDKRPQDAREFARELIEAVRLWSQDLHVLDGVSDTVRDWTPPALPASATGSQSHQETVVDMAAVEVATPAHARHVAVLYLELQAPAAPADDGAIDDHLEALAVLTAKVRQAVREHGGDNVGPLADHQLALFGHHDGDEASVESAISAGLALRTALAALAADPTMPDAFDLTFRLGVAVGTVVVGEVSDAGPICHGEPVFRARELARGRDAGEVRITQHAYRMVRGLFDCDMVRVRGRGTHWTVGGRRPVARRRVGQVGIHGVPISLVGRAKELAMLRRVLDRVVQDHRLGVALLTGAPGVGKTRLAWEFARLLDEREEAYYLEVGECTHAGVATPYEPFSQALRARTRIEDGDPEAEVAIKIEHYVRRFLARSPTELEEDDRRFAELLHELLVVKGTGDTPALTDTMGVHGSGAQRAALFSRIAALYRRLAERHPVVFLIDDFQWASQPTRGLLAYLAEHLADDRVLFLVISRDEADEEAGAVFRDRVGVTRIELGPLSRREADKLIRHALRCLDEVPNGLVRSIAELAQGFPLIIEETIHDLIDEGTIKLEGERWRLESSTRGRIKLPKTVEQLLAGRVERLPPPLRLTLEAAAVAGRQFWPGQLRAMLGEAYPQYALADLERRGFVAARKDLPVAGEADHAFVQFAMRETTYRMVPKARRKELHAAVAAWLEAHAEGSATQLGDEVGHHWLEAGRADKALDYTLLAARRARRIYAIEEAVGHLQACRRILAQVPPGAMSPEARREVTAEVESDLVHLLALSGELPAAVELSDRVIAAGSRDSGGWRRVAGAAIRKAWVLMFLGSYKEAETAVDQAEEATKTIRDRTLALRIATARAAIQAKVADAASAAGIIRHALKALGAPPEGDHEVLAHLSDAYRTLGNCEIWQGRHPQAQAAYQKAYELGVQANAPELIVDALNGLGAQAYYRGLVDDAGRRWREALAIAEKWDLLQHRVILLTNLAELLWSRAAHNDAVELVSRAEALGEYLGTDETLADAHRIHAEALLALKQPDEAETHAKKALQHAQAVGSPQILGHAHRTMAKVMRALIGHGHPTASPKVMAYHLGHSTRAFEAAGMAAEVEVTRKLRTLFLGSRA